MYRAIVFAGTTEGYEISRYLSGQSVPVLVCTATEYGAESLTEDECLHVRSGRMTAEEMEALFREEKPEIVVDATHPYAVLVTENIEKACRQTEIPYLRVLRTDGNGTPGGRGVVCVEDVSGAVEFLRHTEGNVLLTTGSKELAAFTGIEDYKSRLFARVLSLPSVMVACKELGFEGRNLIGMQGPFSRELNSAMLRQYGCRYLVTKDTGGAGGFTEKIEAAQECGVTAVVIGRPPQKAGVSVKEAKVILAKTLGFERKTQVSLVGIGMGGRETMTLEAEKAIREAELVIGASRMVEAAAGSGQDVLVEYKSDVIADYIRNHPEYERVAVVLSGDVGFYSGAKKLLDLLGPDTRVICGISSAAYFMAKIGMSWDDAVLVSAHGREGGLLSAIRDNRKVFAILGTGNGVSQLAEKLVFYGMGNVVLYVGENLSYENEKVFSGKAEELISYQGTALCVICAVNEAAAGRKTTHGISDGAFLRGKAPMTKEEIRTVSLAKLRLYENSICYDVGAGTGSVAIEMALCAPKGRVYAIEKKEDALALLEENKKKFQTDNLEIVSGMAPEALNALPAPDRAFIGGSSGKLLEIVELLLSKNPDVRMVVNSITLETAGEIARVLERHPELEQEIVQIQASRVKKAGPYHLMMGENPVTIAVLQRNNETEKGEAI